MGYSVKTAAFFHETRIADAARGDIQALFDLGMLYATGSAEVDLDLIEAHKWFNLAAVNGHPGAQEARAEMADEMSAREIVEAQRKARAWLSSLQQRAA